MSILGDCKAQQPLAPIADIGGKTVLGMSGSLTNYINTGNPHICENDTFSLKSKSDDSKKNKKPSVFEKISLTGAPVSGYFIAGAVLAALLIKSVATGDFTKALKKMTTNIVSGAKIAHTKNSPKIAQFFKSIPGKCAGFFKKNAFWKKP